MQELDEFLVRFLQPFFPWLTPALLAAHLDGLFIIARDIPSLPLNNGLRVVAVHDEIFAIQAKGVGLLRR